MPNEGQLGLGGLQRLLQLGALGVVELALIHDHLLAVPEDLREEPDVRLPRG